jgi:hypothetical protein
MASDLRKRGGALGQIRTADTRFRRAVLYPLSYEGGGLTGRHWDAMVRPWMVQSCVRQGI